MFSHSYDFVSMFACMYRDSELMFIHMCLHVFSWSSHISNVLKSPQFSKLHEFRLLCNLWKNHSSWNCLVCAYIHTFACIHPFAYIHTFAYIRTFSYTHICAYTTHVVTQIIASKVPRLAKAGKCHRNPMTTCWILNKKAGEQFPGILGSKYSVSLRV